MGFVGSMLGNSSGSGFQAQGVDPAQLSTAYDQTQAGIKQQQDFVTALNGQNGLANQSSVFGQQQGLANQLQGVANGTGPNPALAQLNQQTGRNVSNQAALMAGQRGASQNVGMMARQAAQQGANLQQQAVGQGATMQAQQQLAAMQQLQSQQANMGNMANSQVNQQQAGLSALNQNSLQQQANLMGLQANINSANAGIAGGNQSAQQNILGQGMGAIGSVGSLFGGGGSSAAAGGGDMLAGGDDLMSGGSMMAAQGGMVKMAEGGPAFDPLMTAQAPQATVDTVTVPTNGPKSNVGKMFDTQEYKPAAKSGGGGGLPIAAMMKEGKQLWDLGSKAWKGISHFTEGAGQTLGTAGGALGVDMGTYAGGAADAIAGGAPVAGAAAIDIAPAAVAVAAKGGQVPALVSPGEVRIHAKDVSKVAKGEKSPMSGEKIPGKPNVTGAKNSYANDTVKKTLNEGDIILPRSVTQAKDPAQAAHAFVSAILAKNGKSLPKKAKK